MVIRIATSHEGSRCLFCHDTLGTPRLECRACHALYHEECATHCFTLGCRTKLTPVALRAQPATARADVSEFNLVPMILGFLATVAVLLVTVATQPGPQLVVICACSLFLLVLFVMIVGLAYASECALSETHAPVTRPPVALPLATEPQAPRRPVPVELPLVDVPAEDALAARLDQLEALRARRRPGLGRTI